MNNIELLAPAGNLSKLKTAFQYGADAVYLGGGAFSLRCAADNFNDSELAEGISYAHSLGKKAYVTANIVPRNNELEDIREYARMLEKIEADAIIVSDIGSFNACRKGAPNTAIHISTQANITNYGSAMAWHKLGASRVVLARELSMNEIAEINEKKPQTLEMEAFVHGAMCVSYSGRCLLSNYMVSRDSNKGDCAQPCRWKYHLVEEKREGEYMPVYENDRGTFIFNSKDLCLIPYIPQLAKAGVTSFKIEGRVKSEYYLATVVKAYREEIDRFLENPEAYKFDEQQLSELSKVSHRGYSTGFFTGDRGQQVYETSSYIRNYDVMAVVTEYDPIKKVALLEQRNKLLEGEKIEIMQPGKPNFIQMASSMRDEKNIKITATPHSKMKYFMPMNEDVAVGSFVRKKCTI